MAKYRANFFDKNGDEFRSLIVEAKNENDAEDKAETEANQRGWPESFRLGDVEEID